MMNAQYSTATKCIQKCTYINTPHENDLYYENVFVAETLQSTKMHKKIAGIINHQSGIKKKGHQVWFL